MGVANSEHNLIRGKSYERKTVAEEILGVPSEAFHDDFWRVIEALIERNGLGQNQRARLNMPPEPYGLPHDGDGLHSRAALVEHVANVIKNGGDSWQWLYERLGDSDSKFLLLTVLAYRCLGWFYVPMPLDTANFWNALQEFSVQSEHATNAEHLLTSSGTIRLSRFDLGEQGFDVRVFSDAFGVFNEYVHPQYLYRGKDLTISPSAGDTVLDCGACFGGTSLFFASMVAPTGRVVSFEFLPDNLAVLERNFAENPKIAGSLTIVRQPVWSDASVEMAIVGSGPATQVHPWPLGNATPDSTAKLRRVQATSIDTIVEELALTRVDMIKMDIEGSEYQALLGAKNTISRFRPNLALCVYHKLVDFYELAQFVDMLDLGYKFYFQHSTVHGDETVLFATARSPNPEDTPDQVAVPADLDQITAALVAALAERDKARAALAAAVADRASLRYALAEAVAQRDRARRYPWKYLRYALAARRNKH
jgi:FkbM family methyltransferase